MSKNLFKRLFSAACACSLFAVNCLALPPKLRKIRECFLDDCLRFEYDEDFVSRKWDDIIVSYNSETGKNITDISGVPRSYLIPRILPLYKDKKMICSTQCIYYSELLKKAKVENYIIHIMQYERSTSGEVRLTCVHDDLIYFDSDAECWKVMDFSSPVKEVEKARNMGLTTTMTPTVRKIFIERYFEKKLSDKLIESKDHWLAVGYYDGDSIKDLRELVHKKSAGQADAKKICSILNVHEYKYVENHEGRPIIRL